MTKPMQGRRAAAANPRHTVQMSPNDNFERDAESIESDAWEQFRDEDAEPIRIAEFSRLDISNMPEDACVSIMDDYFPETRVQREGEFVICEIEEHLYTKYWEHKFSAYAFAEAMERAVVRLQHEGHPVQDPSRDDDDVHIFVRWNLKLPRGSKAEEIAQSVKAAFDLVWHRADSILENSDSVLVLGKDTGPGLERLKRIAAKLEDMGYYPTIVKEQPDRQGEGIIQKVLRFALSSKFVVVENTEPSGHLYELPHVVKMAECITVVLQEQGKGATWMFEDAYAKHRHWHKLEYEDTNLELGVEKAAEWAEKFATEFSKYQESNLPWRRASKN